MKSVAVCLTLALLATISLAQPAPPVPGSIMDLLMKGRQDRLSTLVGAIQAAGLFDTLQKDGPFMLFAPLNDAFKALPEGTVAKLMASPADLRKLLLNHVFKGNTVFGDLKAGDLTNMNGGIIKVMVSSTDDKLVGNAKIYSPSRVNSTVVATNGVIYYIDQVLLP